MKNFFLVVVLLIASFLLWEKIPKVDFPKIDFPNVNNGSSFKNNSEILVLNYHQIKKGNTSLSIDPKDFELQMEYLVNNDYVSVTPEEFYDGLTGKSKLPDKAVFITFDDGYIDNYTEAFPILKKYGIHATVFVVPAFTGSNPFYLNWQQLKEMEAEGISVESHTLNHVELESLSDDEIRFELLNSKLLIERNLGHSVEFLAYPTGTYNLHIAGIAQEVGYKGAFTIEYGIVNSNSNLFALERVSIFRATRTMKDFYERVTWRQSFEKLGWYKP